jgi:hypothetical protein
VNAGAWFGIIPLLFMTVFGPKVTALIGAFMTLIGYIVVAAAGYGGDVSMDVVMFMAFVIGFGGAWTQAAAFITNSVNCLPRHRGVVVGLLQGTCAFAGGLYSVMDEIFDFSAQFFMLFIGVSMFTFVLIAYPSNHRIHWPDNKLYADTLLVVPLLCMLGVLGILIMWASLTDDTGLLILVFIMLCLFVLAVARLSMSMFARYGTSAVYPYPAIIRDEDDYFDLINFEFIDIDNNILRKEDEANASSQEVTPLISQVQEEAEDDGEEAKAENVEAQPTPKTTTPKATAKKTAKAVATAAAAANDNDEASADAETGVGATDGAAPTLATSGGGGGGESRNTSLDDTVSVKAQKVDDSYSLFEALSTFQFWLFFLSFSMLVGVNTGIADSIDDIIDAYSKSGGSTTYKEDCESVYSVFSGLGRVSFGIASDYLAFHYGVSRFTLLTVCYAALLVDCVFLAYANLAMITVTMIIGGFFYGGAVVMTGTIALDFFGPTNFGLIYGCLNFSAIIGTELFYGLLLTGIYNHYNDSSGVCYGNRACFKTTFWLYAMFMGIGVAIAVFLSSDKNKSRRAQKDK